MKRYFARIAVVAVVAAGIAGWAYNMSVEVAQATANANVAIVPPIAIAKTIDLNFGSIVTDTVARTAAVSTAGAITCTGALICVGTTAAASFDVTGGDNLTYSIDINGGEADATLTGPGTNMTVDTWTSNPTPTGTLSAGGAETLLVGGTLNVGANQADGDYTGTFTVDVLYN